MTTPQPPVGTVAYANWTAQQIVQGETQQRSQQHGQRNSAYGAVAVSPLSAEWAWSWNHPDANSAVQTAVSRINAADRTWLYWACNQFVVLLRASNGTFHAGADADVQRATKMALQSAGKGATLLLCFETSVGANIVARPVAIS